MNGDDLKFLAERMNQILRDEKGLDEAFSTLEKRRQEKAARRSEELPPT